MVPRRWRCSMPGSSTRPEVAARMVFLTGGVFEAHAEQFLREHARWCMGKRFEPGTLLALVAERIASADALAPCHRMV